MQQKDAGTAKSVDEQGAYVHDSGPLLQGTEHGVESTLDG